MYACIKPVASADFCVYLHDLLCLYVELPPSPWTQPIKNRELRALKEELSICTLKDQVKQEAKLFLFNSSNSKYKSI